jgi:hypothetical protein
MGRIVRDLARDRTQKSAIVVDDSEAVRESHARTLQCAGYNARSLSFEAAMTLSDAELMAVDLAVVDLHDSRPPTERAEEAVAAGVADQLRWYERLPGCRLLERLDQLAAMANGGPVPRVVVASAVMQLEPVLTGRVYELPVVSGAFSTFGVATEARWLEGVQSATSWEESPPTAKEWWSDIPSCRSYQRLVRLADDHPLGLRFILERGGRPNRAERRDIEALNEKAGARGYTLWRGSLRSMLRKLFGLDLPHAEDEEATPSG